MSITDENPLNVYRIETAVQQTITAPAWLKLKHRTISNSRQEGQIANPYGPIKRGPAPLKLNA